MPITTEQRMADAATSTLVHYFKTAYTKLGIAWGEDNEMEIAEAVAAIIDAAQPNRA